MSVTRGGFRLKRALTTGAVLRRANMIRLTLNVFQEMEHLFPDWVEERPRVKHTGSVRAGELLFDSSRMFTGRDSSFDLIDLGTALSEDGFALSSAIRKPRGEGWRTSQLLLVFEWGGVALSSERTRELFDRFVGDGEGEQGFVWSTKAFMNSEIGTIPRHITIHCSIPRRPRGQEHHLDVVEEDLVLFERQKAVLEKR